MKVDLKDVLGGAMMVLISLYALVMAPGYGIGTPTNMGSGFLPMVLGIVGIGLGLGIAIPALFRTGMMEAIEWRPLLAVVAAIAAFAAITAWIGYLPGTAAATGLAAIGDKKSRLLSTILLMIGVTIGVWLIFSVGLRIAPQAWKGF